MPPTGTRFHRAKRVYRMFSKGQKFQGRVKDIASDGRAVVQHENGRVVFVQGAWRDELIEARISQIKGRVAFATVVKVIEASGERVEPSCHFHGVGENACGGCPWMFVDYQAQLAAKQRRVEQEFSRLGAHEQVRVIQPSTKQLGYRNRAQLKTDGERLGFVANQSNTLVDIDTCPILSAHNAENLRALRAKLPSNQWRPKRRDNWISLDIDDQTLLGDASVNARLPFRQANDAQNAFMREWLGSKLRQTCEGSSALELFCGSGNLTDVIAPYVSSLIAVEGVEAAITQLQEKQLPNVEALTANLYDEKSLNSVLKRAKKAKTLVLDPPREGLKVLGELFKINRQLNDVFYISCDLATLMRDTRKFIEQGFIVKDAQPVDMFPQTPHIEMLVWLSR